MEGRVINLDQFKHNPFTKNANIVHTEPLTNSVFQIPLSVFYVFFVRLLLQYSNFKNLLSNIFPAISLFIAILCQFLTGLTTSTLT